MADIATISALLTSVKTATDIAKLIKESNSSLEAAEFKLNMAELISSLADVKIEVAVLQDELRDRDEKIRDLEAKLNLKTSLKFDGKLHWVEGDDTPFCTYCLEKNDKKLHLRYIPEGEYFSEQWKCKACESSYYIRD
ncbi:hypothetical protein QVK62_004171 [Vibrio parahaemolyticus]|nr:hypothetical protein [Vibrio parahaemolyticus]HAS8524305.1 hypothetical protein [Vibrio vulnificus]